MPGPILEDGENMNLTQVLMILAISSLAMGALLARSHLRTDRGLRRAFLGLALSGMGGLALSFSRPPIAVLPLALLMLGGIGILISGLPARPKERGDKPC